MPAINDVFGTTSIGTVFTATCPQGSTATGGGFDRTTPDAPTDNLAILESHPFGAPPDGWFIRTAGGTDVIGRAVVMCLPNS